MIFWTIEVLEEMTTCMYLHYDNWKFSSACMHEQHRIVAYTLGMPAPEAEFSIMLWIGLSGFRVAAGC